MRILTATGYYGTGSSAITDFLGEFSDCYSLTDYEFRFLQDPGGISDLEFNLVENHHRHNSGHALKQYKNMVDFLSGNKMVSKYEPFFNNQWKSISYNYIEQLTDFKFRGYWHQDVIDKGYFFYFQKRLFNKIYQNTLGKHNKEHGYCEMPKEITYCSRPSEEKFLLETQKYTDALFRAANKKRKPDVIVDQLVPPSNVKRYLRYVKNMMVFVVDRDPRDLYLSEKYIYRGTIIPVDNVEIFCKWYSYTRAHRKTEKFPNSNVLFLNFEDLIYSYKKTSEMIMQWLNYTPEKHVHKLEYFNPKKSIKNTQRWKNYSSEEVQKDMKYIEKHLTGYLYDFDKHN